MATVLMIGLDPDGVDFSKWPDLTADQIRKGLKLAFERLRADGHRPAIHLVSDPKSAPGTLRAVLARVAPDIIMVGAGVRVPTDHIQLFEAVINEAHRAAPDAVFAFNATPQDTLGAVERALKRA